MAGRDGPRVFTRARIYSLLEGVKEKIPFVKAETVEADEIRLGDQDKIIYGDGPDASAF